jgi:hypothetical protein
VTRSDGRPVKPCPVAYDHNPDLPDGCQVCGWPHGRRIGPLGEYLPDAAEAAPGRLLHADPATLSGLVAPLQPVQVCGPGCAPAADGT